LYICIPETEKEELAGGDDQGWVFAEAGETRGTELRTRDGAPAGGGKKKFKQARELLSGKRGKREKGES
jgi:hypothetical protein